MRDLIVFSDLDGTLLDHHSYSFDSAQEALGHLKALDVPLVLASSKTASEISVLHKALELGETPAIVENGAGVYWPGKPDATGNYSELRAALGRLSPEMRALFKGFGDMSAQSVAEITGLALQSAMDAKDRRFSEPGLWQGSMTQRAAFIAELAEIGVSARMGGRFLTLSFGASKADRMGAIAEKLGKSVKIALGDAPNDREMLEAADHAVIVLNPDGAGLPALPGEATQRVRRTQHPGPKGWNQAVLELLAELQIKGTP